MDMKTPRINAARMQSYIGKNVRVVAKVIKFQANNVAIVQLADGGQIEVKISSESNMRDQYVEVIGSVEDATTLKMFKAMNLGENLDMAAINHTIELMHTPIMSPYWSTIV